MKIKDLRGQEEIRNETIRGRIPSAGGATEQDTDQARKLDDEA